MARGHTQRVRVSSEPQGALIYEGNDLIGITPTLVILDRKNLVLRLEKEGYRQGEVAINRALSGWIVADLAAGFGPAVGVFSAGGGPPSQAVAAVALTGGVPAGTLIGVDLLTRSAWTLPSSVHVILMPLERRQGA